MSGFPEGPNPWSGRTVLVVDDQDLYHDLTRVSLPDAGRVISAFNGAEGIERAREARPGLILMDLEMPVLGGLDAIGRLKADPATQDIPVVVVTSNNSDEIREACRQTGADGFLLKSVGWEQFPIELRKTLEAAG